MSAFNSSLDCLLIIVLICSSPTWFEFGDVDRLRDEGLLYFTRLAEAGVPCRAELYAEATHLFAGELSFGKQAKLAHKLLADFVNQVTAKQPIKTELVWVTHDCEIKDLGGVEGARKVLRESFDEYLGFVKDKERIRKGWSRFGFLDIWNAVVPGCL